MDLIRQVMTVPEYASSFNKTINHAIKYGIVSLYEEVFLKKNGNGADEIAEVKVGDLLKKKKEDQVIEDYLEDLKTLMKEEILNLTIVKSIASSLYGIKVAEKSGEAVSQKLLEDGRYGRTPKYLESYELQEIKKLRRKNE